MRYAIKQVPITPFVIPSGARNLLLVFGFMVIQRPR
jgi:hypothetical protein